MKRLLFETTTTLHFHAPVVNHQFLLHLIPHSYGGQHIVSAALQLTPDVPYHLFYDGFGNLTETGYIADSHTEFIYQVSGVAEIDVSKTDKVPLHPMFKHPSFYTYTSAEMRAFADTLRGITDPLTQALQLADAIYCYMTYLPGATSTNTLASEAFATRQGVCQDYSHIFIGLARYLGIPARYANGLPLGNGESHAWTEVYIDSKWIGVDPTENRLVGEDYVRFCKGRDFLDCALERGIFIGNTSQSQTTTAQVITCQ